MPVFFTIFVIFSVIFYIRICITQNKYQKNHDNFIKREIDSFKCPKKNISDLPYIKLDKNIINISSTDSFLSSLQKKLEKLSTKKILNLTGYTNTDLRYMYGADNLEFLSECDKNFSKLSTTLHLLGNHLYEIGDIPSAKKIFEYAVELNVDISEIYFSLSNIYILDGTPQKINTLIHKANLLNSFSSNHVSSTLQNKLYNLP